MWFVLLSFTFVLINGIERYHVNDTLLCNDGDCVISCELCENINIICLNNVTSCNINCLKANSCNNVSINDYSTKTILNCQYTNSCNNININLYNNISKCDINHNSKDSYTNITYTNNICQEHIINVIKNNIDDELRRSLMWKDVKITISQDSLILIGVGLGSVIFVMILAILCICCLCRMYRATEQDLRNKMNETTLPRSQILYDDAHANPSELAKLEELDSSNSPNSLNNTIGVTYQYIDTNNINNNDNNGSNDSSTLNKPNERRRHPSRNDSFSSQFSQYSQMLEVENLIGKLKKRQMEREKEYLQRTSKSSEILQKMKANAINNNKQNNIIHNNISIINNNNNNEYSNITSSLSTQKLIVNDLRALSPNNMTTTDDISHIESKTELKTDTPPKKLSKKRKKIKRGKKKLKKNKKLSKKEMYIKIDRIYNEYIMKFKVIPINIEPILQYCKVNNIKISKEKLSKYFKKRKEYEKNFINFIGSDGTTQNSDMLSTTLTPISNTINNNTLYYSTTNNKDISVQLPPKSNRTGTSVDYYVNKKLSSLVDDSTTHDVSKTFNDDDNNNSNNNSNNNASIIKKNTPNSSLYSFGVPLNKNVSTTHEFSNNKLNIRKPVENLLEKMGWSYHSDTESYLEAKKQRRLDPNYQSSESSIIADYFTDSDTDSNNDNNSDNNNDNSSEFETMDDESTSNDNDNDTSNNSETLTQNEMTNIPPHHSANATIHLNTHNNNINNITDDSDTSKLYIDSTNNFSTTINSSNISSNNDEQVLASILNDMEQRTL